MSDAKKDNYQITLDDAILWTNIWRIANPENSKAYLIPVEDLIDVLKEMGVLKEGKNKNCFKIAKGKTQLDIRAYMAIDPHLGNPEKGPEEKVLIVGTRKVKSPDGSGWVYEDIIRYKIIEDTDGDDDGSGIYDFTEPCPDACDKNSPLF
jgi:hypothetical protein